MISEGKAAGWLQLPPEAFLPWAKLNDIAFSLVLPGVSMGKGGALLASNELNSNHGTPQALITVPRPLILSLERVNEHAKVDKDFREVLESLGEFGRSQRGVITASDFYSGHGGISTYADGGRRRREAQSSPFCLSKSPCLVHICPNVRHVPLSRLGLPWYWPLHGTVYRPRQPRRRSSYYSHEDGDGNAILLLRDGKSVAKGDEVTITYGDEKGACEMMFSYGFLEPERQSAETLFLSLGIPDDDPYRGAKMNFADCAPGVKLIDAGDGDIDWKGDFVWLLCVSEEDGLHFDLARTVDGEEEVHAFFGDHELMGGAQELHAVLGKTEMWDVYRLRAATILQQRVFEQMQILYGTQEEVEATMHGEGTDVRDRCYEQAMQLRKLEMELLNRAYEDFELQTERFADSEVVLQYLARVNDNDPRTNVEQDPVEVEEEDFS
ncbi:hypothetical protein LTR54_008380 [Friedmanniomyces endolithicus]|nr:hypothetical protein LTR54_008380 [Friedmanniomyces endolithicus]